MKTSQQLKKIILGQKFCAGLSGFLIIFSLACVSPLYANNLTIRNVELKDRNAALNTAVVEFDVSWDNSWRNQDNHDAVWLFIKIDDCGAASNGYDHGVLYASGLNPAGTSPGTSTVPLQLYVASDKTGAFLRRTDNGTGSVDTANVRLVWDYQNTGTGCSDSASVTIKVFGIEMVYIPQGSFSAGDVTGFSFSNSGATGPWSITSEATINTALSGSYYYPSPANTGEDVDGAVFTLPRAFPKGYQAFYCMKYEITEGQWVDFFNTLSSTQLAARDMTSAANDGKAADTAIRRNTVSIGSTIGSATTTRPDRAMSYLSWMDLAAYLDWAALRPMTELEFEKICRGTADYVAGEYAWGSTTITAATTITTATIGFQEPGTETITDAGANVNYNSITFTGGDAGGVANDTTRQGTLRAGVFATASTTRQTSGASYYGVMEMSGNVWERVVTVGNPTGRIFSGTHGDGNPHNKGVAADGDANVVNWPGSDGVTVTGALGSGFRGGDAKSTTTQSRLTISGRRFAAHDNTSRSKISTVGLYSFGGRGVRTADSADPVGSD